MEVIYFLLLAVMYVEGIELYDRLVKGIDWRGVARPFLASSSTDKQVRQAVGLLGEGLKTERDNPLLADIQRPSDEGKYTFIAPAALVGGDDSDAAVISFFAVKQMKQQSPPSIRYIKLHNDKKLYRIATVACKHHYTSLRIVDPMMRDSDKRIAILKIDRASETTSSDQHTTYEGCGNVRL